MKKIFIIAEAGVNHNGSFELAKELITIAANSGADAVKFQNFKADELVTHAAPKAGYQLAATDQTESQFDMLKKLELSDEITKELQNYANKNNILFLSTPFDITSLNFLLFNLNLPIIKIASGELTNLPLLLKIAQVDKQVILSTGMATLGEIEFALNILAYGYMIKNKLPTMQELWRNFSSEDAQEKLKQKVTLLHCTTEYPAPYSEVNLNVITTLKSAFHLPVGYSDHTKGIEVSIAAAALGAEVIEKHFTVDKTLTGPDHAASLDPSELKSMVQAIRHIELCLSGHGKKLPTLSEINNRQIVRKSLVALSEIQAGNLFNEDNLGLKRPGNGISALHYWDWIGKKASRHYHINEMIEDL